MSSRMDSEGRRRPKANAGDPYPQYDYQKVPSISGGYPDSQDSQFSRRSSVFTDLFSLLRKNTTTTMAIGSALGGRKPSLYHAPPAGRDREIEKGNAELSEKV